MSEKSFPRREPLCEACASFLAAAADLILPGVSQLTFSPTGGGGGVRHSGGEWGRCAEASSPLTGVLPWQTPNPLGGFPDPSNGETATDLTEGLEVL